MLHYTNAFRTRDQFSLPHRKAEKDPVSRRLLVTAALAFYASGSFPVSGISHIVRLYSTVTSNLVLHIQHSHQ